MTTDQPQPKPVKPLWPSSLPFIGAVEEQEKKRLKTLTAQAIAIVESGEITSELPELLNQMWGIEERW